MNKKYLVLLIILIFIISCFVRYWSVYHKGFPSSTEVDNLILARNLNLTGEYKIDNEKNIVLSSTIIREKGVISGFGNQLTPILYSVTFKLIDLKHDLPLHISIILYGIISVLLFALVQKLFNVKVAFLFSLFDIFSPLTLQYSTRAGLYEWAMLFLTIALLIYFWKERPGIVKLLLIGLLMGLASFSRNSFLIIPIAFALCEFIKNKSFKRAIVFILPLIIIWGIYLGPGFLKGGSNVDYLGSETNTNDYMHIFPDPYVFNFERDAYVKGMKESGNYNYDYSQFLGKYGYPVSFKDKILMYWASITSYPKGLIAQTTFGGPILVFLMILGGFYLYKNKKYLLGVFILWGLSTYLFLIIAKSNHWGHFITFQFPIFLMVSLGVYWILQFIKKCGFKKYIQYLFIGSIIITLFIHLVQSDKWMFHENYENSDMRKSILFSNSINKNNVISKESDIIAIGLQNPATSIMNWYTDHSYVRFDEQTIKNLLKENKLQWAFDQFGVTQIIGYDENLTKEILQSTDINEIEI